MGAIRSFEEALPGWWYSVGTCSVSRDASCGPDRNGPDAYLLSDKEFDAGFHCDDRDGSMADALANVMKQALEAKARSEMEVAHPAKPKPLSDRMNVGE